MLEKLLHLVGEGGLHSYAELAKQLAVPRPLLQAMIEDLARLGYLRPVDGGCDQGCAGCPVPSDNCSSALRWTLTAKGARAARQA
jgi:hypothetical protein